MLKDYLMGYTAYMEYSPKTFTIPELDGISAENIKQHIGLYEGYVKNFNAISATLATLAKNPDSDPIVFSELVRRHSFEFGGMRLHELYFPQLEGGTVDLNVQGAFATAVAKEFGSAGQLISEMKRVASMRGPGWSLLYWDPAALTFHIGFSGEQHQGHFVTLPIVLAIDVWEHAFLIDHGASGKGKYLEAFFKNLNWDVVEKRFETLLA